jgi:hypothetical protein
VTWRLKAGIVEPEEWKESRRQFLTRTSSSSSSSPPPSPQFPLPSSPLRFILVYNYIFQIFQISQFLLHFPDLLIFVRHLALKWSSASICFCYLDWSYSHTDECCLSPSDSCQIKYMNAALVLKHHAFLAEVWFPFLTHLSRQVSDGSEVIRSQSCGATSWSNHTSQQTSYQDFCLAEILLFTNQPKKQLTISVPLTPWYSYVSNILK